MVSTVILGRPDVAAVTLGAGDLVIVAPVVGEDADSVRQQWEAAADAGADIVEWRLDHAWAAVEQQLGEDLRANYRLPVILTVRTAFEGGRFAGEWSDYEALIERAAKWADAVDIELNCPSRHELLRTVKLEGAKCVLSHHVYDRPVDQDELRYLLYQMEESSADVAKVAWTVSSPEDLRLILATQRWARANLSIPAAVIGMGDLGVDTRSGDPARQSAFTFAVAAAASAPGQLSIARVKELDERRQQ